MGKAFFETEAYEEAQRLYEEAFEVDGGDVETLERIVFSSCKLIDYATADKYLDRAAEEKKIPPHVIASLKDLLLQRMGSPELALHYAKEEAVGDKDQMGTLKLDTAAERTQWDEFDVALQILEQEVRIDPNNSRARTDYIAALCRKHRMKEVSISTGRSRRRECRPLTRRMRQSPMR